MSAIDKYIQEWKKHLDAGEKYKAILIEEERQKWISACVEFGAEDEGTTAHKIMQKGME